MSACLLAILDGFGIGENITDNAIVQANHPTFNHLFAEPHARLWTHGPCVGLPEGQTG